MTTPLVLVPGTAISDKERAGRLLEFARDTARRLADLAHPGLHPGEAAGWLGVLMAAIHDYDGLQDGTLTADQVYRDLVPAGHDVAVERAWNAVCEHIWTLTHGTEGETR